MNDPNLRVEELLKRIARELREISNRSGQQWNEAVITRLVSKDGRSGFSKLRIRLDAGTLDGMSPPIDWIDVWDELWDLRSKGLANKWYGIVIRVQPNGTSKVEFNYDENCISDPDFFES